MDLLKELEAAVNNAESRKQHLIQIETQYAQARAESEQSIQQVREVRDKISRYIESLGKPE